jgi:putative acetyltransferase
MVLVIAPADPRSADVRALLNSHLEFSRVTTPAGYAFAFDIEDLLGPAVRFFAAREEGELVGVGALHRLDPRHAELKSMHTRESARGRGIARAIVEHLLGFTREQDYERVSLETGTMEAFAPARALYASMGFRPCGPLSVSTSRPRSTRS